MLDHSRTDIKVYFYGPLFYSTSSLTFAYSKKLEDIKVQEEEREEGVPSVTNDVVSCQERERQGGQEEREPRERGGDTIREK
ncbi:hypothetical protein B296_00038219 [Ensete ventricosum]|uniref:Uncharacterized protein n=1 Tax=Ensete ventricosum TaxID=4639 RepID=A0A426XD98_ENSVE|nr:hypothetical protein B296_00038219 [Ensete ventricosum]